MMLGQHDKKALFAEPPVPRAYEPLVPLINIVFLIQIFFLLAGTMGPREHVNVTLPKSAVDDKQAGDGVTLVLEQDGFVWLGERVMDPALAPLTLQRSFDENGVKAVAINADAGSQAHDLLVLLEGLRKIGIERVTIVTERDE